jgi:hypothetical protein
MSFDVPFEIGNSVAFPVTPKLRENIDIRKLQLRFLFEREIGAAVYPFEGVIDKNGGT